MQRHCRHRTHLAHHTSRAKRFARLEHAGSGKHGGAEILHIAARTFCGGFHRVEVLLEFLLAGDGCHPAVANLTSNLERLGTLCRDNDRNVLLDVDVAESGMHETNPTLAFSFPEKDLVATQQRPADSYVLAQIIQLHRKQAHHVAASESRANPEHHAPWRKLVDSRDRMCGYRRDSIAGHHDASADLD